MALPAEVDELTPAWLDLRGRLRQAVGDSTYEIWLAALEFKGWDGAVVVLQAPPTTQAWVAKRFGRVLEGCARGAFGTAARVAFAGSTGLVDEGQPQSKATPVEPHSDRGSRLNPRFSFDQFVIGAGNRLAHAASLAVAEHPGQAYNPLFLHAPPGLGKTHLLHAIGNYLLAFGSGAKVRYTTVEAFTNHFIGSLGRHSLDGFKRAYRDADVLLIDDVQFLASKAKTAEEFFHTFNALYETGRQLVLTCDRLPRQLLDIEERLRERFESGLVADIEPPDLATRLTILRKRAALDHIAVADSSVFLAIAERITDNVRALEGALIRVVAHHSLTGQPIDERLAAQVLDGMYPRRPSVTPSIKAIQAVVGSYFVITPDEICSATRTAQIAWARQIAIHLARELTDHSLAEIGAAFGGRNHATVLHACRRVSARRMTDPAAATDVDKLAAMIRSEQPDRSC